MLSQVQIRENEERVAKEAADRAERESREAVEHANQLELVCFFAKFLRFLKKNLRFWSNFDVFRCKFYKNRAPKTLVKKLKSGSENLKP